MTFVPDLSVLLTYVVAVVVIAITPGPDMTFFVSRAIAQGRASGISAMAGALSGVFVHTSLVAFGLAALIVASPFLFSVLKIGGALYLAFLAYQAIRHGSAFNVSGEKLKSRSLWRDYVTGIWVNLLNPKIILFFMTFLPQFVSVGDANPTGKFFFLGVVFVVVSLPFTLPIVFVATRFADWMKKNSKVTRVIDYLFASIFGAFAIRILFTERG